MLLEGGTIEPFITYSMHEPIELISDFTSGIIHAHIYFSGMVHSGIGHTHMSNFMSALEIPSINHRSLKQREEEAAKHIEVVAQASCEQALQEEVAMSQNEDRFV